MKPFAVILLMLLLAFATGFPLYHLEIEYGHMEYAIVDSTKFIFSNFGLAVKLFLYSLSGPS